MKCKKSITTAYGGGHPKQMNITASRTTAKTIVLTTLKFFPNNFEIPLNNFKPESSEGDKLHGPYLEILGVWGQVSLQNVIRSNRFWQ